MENQAPAVFEPMAKTTVDQPPVETTSYNSGGFAQKMADFKLVEYLTFALIIVASVYNIYYHKQALGKLNDE